MKISKNVLSFTAILMISSGMLNGQNTSQTNNNSNFANVNSADASVNTQVNQNVNRPTNSTPPTNINSAVTSQTAAPLPPTEPVIEDIYRLGYEDDKDERNKAGIRDIIIIKIRNLKKLVDDSLCKDDKGGRKPNCTDQKIALFLEGRKIEAVEQEAISLKGNDGTIQFHLSRKADVNDEAWADLLGNPPVGDGFFFRKDTKVSIGLENQYAAAEPKNFDLIRIVEWRFWVFTILYIFLLFLIYRLAVKSDILRDIGDLPDGAKKDQTYGILRAFEFGNKDEIRKPYSLARFQMAFWFLLVIGSFFYIWLITGALDIITTEILALIGIGAGTALGAAAIDSGKRESVRTDVKTKSDELTKLETEIADLDKQINAVPAPANVTALQDDKEAKKERQDKLKNEIKNYESGLKAKSEGFLKDVLTDATGVSFHRFQIFVWTLVLGIIFVISVWTRLSMPEFGATLLALLGISAGTYLGFKIPENQTNG